jgi:hypothetical protein
MYIFYCYAAIIITKRATTAATHAAIEAWGAALAALFWGSWLLQLLSE